MLPNAGAQGVMVSATDLAERTMHAMEALRNMFSALFLASIGAPLPARRSLQWHAWDSKPDLPVAGRWGGGGLCMRMP